MSSNIPAGNIFLLHIALQIVVLTNLNVERIEIAHTNLKIYMLFLCVYVFLIAWKSSCIVMSTKMTILEFPYWMRAFKTFINEFGVAFKTRKMSPWVTLNDIDKMRNKLRKLSGWWRGNQATTNKQTKNWMKIIYYCSMNQLSVSIRLILF